MSEKEEIILEMLEEFEMEIDYRREKYEIEESIYKNTDSRFYRKDKPFFEFW